MDQSDIINLLSDIKSSVKVLETKMDHVERTNAALRVEYQNDIRSVKDEMKQIKEEQKRDNAIVTEQIKKLSEMAISWKGGLGTAIFLGSIAISLVTLADKLYGWVK